MEPKTLKILGILATILGIGTSLLSEFVGEKKLDIKISEKVDKALAAKQTV